MAEFLTLDKPTREAFEAFRGRDPDPTGAGQKVLHIKQPNFPQYRFEWHPQSRKVYMVRLGWCAPEGEFVPLDEKTPLIGEKIAEHAETHGAAFGAVQTFLRGYREGRTPNLAKTHLED